MNDEGFVWDRDKLELVRQKHGVEFKDVLDVVFDERHLVDDDPQGNMDRYMLVGRARSGRVLQVICTSESLHLTRFITAFEANEYWKAYYDQD